MKKLMPILALILCNNCMVSPYDGQEFDSRVSPYTFDGYVNYSNRKVDVQIYDFDNQNWVTFGSTYTSTVSDVGPGQGWYPWDVTLQIPRSKRFWPASQYGLGKIRAISNSSPLYTGDETLWQCVIGQLQYNLSYSEAYEFCDQTNGQMKEVAILGDCDIVINGGCYDSFYVANKQEKDWPSSKEHTYTEVIQGITHDDNYWYMSSTAKNGSLVRYSKNGNLENDPPLAVESIFYPGWYHPGDIDYSNGWIYVALEKTAHNNTGNASSNAIGAIPTNSLSNINSYLTFNINAGPQQQNGTLPWIARDPGTNYFYSSVFSNTNKLQRYKASFDSNGRPVSFQHCGEVTLSGTIDRVQGGAFSPSGRLYLSLDARYEGPGIIRVVDLKGHLTGFDNFECSQPPTTQADIIKSFNIRKNYGSFTVEVPCFSCGWPFTEDITYYNEEVEGITIWNLSSTDTPSTNAEGSIHVLLLDREPGNDGYWLKHIKVDPIENL